MKGSAISYCLPDGTWSNAPPTCTGLLDLNFLTVSNNWNGQKKIRNNVKILTGNRYSLPVGNFSQTLSCSSKSQTWIKTWQSPGITVAERRLVAMQGTSRLVANLPTVCKTEHGVMHPRSAEVWKSIEFNNGPFVSSHFICGTFLFTMIIWSLIYTLLQPVQLEHIALVMAYKHLVLTAPWGQPQWRQPVDLFASANVKKEQKGHLVGLVLVNMLRSKSDKFILSQSYSFKSYLKPFNLFFVCFPLWIWLWILNWYTNASNWTASWN